MQPTSAQVGKAAIKRKSQEENPSLSSEVGISGGKKVRTLAPEVVGRVLVAAQLTTSSQEVRERSSDHTNTTVVEYDHQATSNATATSNEGPAEANAVGVSPPETTATTTLKPNDPTAASSVSLAIPLADELLLAKSSPGTVQRGANLPVILQLNPKNTQRGSLSESKKLPSLQPGWGSKRTRANMLLLPQAGMGNMSRGSIPNSGEERLLRPTLATEQTKAIHPPFRGLPKELKQRSPDTVSSASSIASGGTGTMRVAARRFRGLELNTNGKISIPELIRHPTTASGNPESATFTPGGSTIYHQNLTTDTKTSTSPALVILNLPRKQDHEVPASIIRNPPRYSLRRYVEKTARVLALVAFYGFSQCASLSLPGELLKRFAGLSRNYRYASTLAFTHLIRIEFPGKRTERWFKAKRIDEKVADVRSWYWHRVSERVKVIERVRTSWVERVWRFLVLASLPATSKPAADTRQGRFGLWFDGVSQHLLADPDLDGQFETAIRFWIRRFYVWVTRSGGGYPQLLQDLRDEKVQDIQPLDEKGNQELWRLETRCGGVHFIIGMTGEVVGWVEADGAARNGLESTLQRRAKTRIGTMTRPRTTVKGVGNTFAAGSPQRNERNQNNAGNVTWQDLRGDWRGLASALVSSASAFEETDTLPKSLLESVYRPDSKTISHGIHESVKYPHHRVLAERWILAQVEPGGISGKPVLDAFHGQVRRNGKVALDLQAKLTVESVRCSGEKWTSSMRGVLAQGLGFVQTPGMGWFVLEETGQVSCWDLFMRVMPHDYRINKLTCDLLVEYSTGRVWNSGPMGHRPWGK